MIIIFVELFAEWILPPQKANALWKISQISCEKCSYWDSKLGPNVSENVSFGCPPKSLSYVGGITEFFMNIINPWGGIVVFGVSVEGENVWLMLEFLPSNYTKCMNLLCRWLYMWPACIISAWYDWDSYH